MATVTGSQSDDWMIQESNWNVKYLIKDIWDPRKEKEIDQEGKKRENKRW